MRLQIRKKKTQVLLLFMSLSSKQMVLHFFWIVRLAHFWKSFKYLHGPSSTRKLSKQYDQTFSGSMSAMFNYCSKHSIKNGNNYKFIVFFSIANTFMLKGKKIDKTWWKHFIRQCMNKNFILQNYLIRNNFSTPDLFKVYIATFWAQSWCRSATEELICSL